jgi:hypothetical protein
MRVELNDRFKHFLAEIGGDFRVHEVGNEASAITGKEWFGAPDELPSEVLVFRASPFDRHAFVVYHFEHPLVWA